MSAARHRPRAVVFDVVETLIQIEPLRGRLDGMGVSLDHWYDRILRDGMALTLAGSYQPFPAVARAALRVLGGGHLTDSQVEHVMAGFGELPAHPDVEPAMRALVEAGVSVNCLTNGARETTAAFLARTGLDRFVDQVIPVAEIGKWKPPVAVYEHALRRLNRPAGDVALIAVHAFDCHGAHAAGLTTGWASRRERHYPDIFNPADVRGANLVEVVGGLLALSPAEPRKP